MQSAACPRCGFAPREIPAAYWGRKVKCPSCKESYRLPAEPPGMPQPARQELLPAIPPASYIEPPPPAMMPQFPTSPAMPHPGAMPMEQIYAHPLAPQQPYAPYPPQYMPPQQYAPQQPQIVYVQAPAPTVHVTNVNTNVNSGGRVKHNSWANVALLMGLCAPVFGWIPLLGLAWCVIGMLAALAGLVGAAHSYGAGRSFLGGLASFIMFFPAVASTSIVLMR